MDKLEMHLLTEILWVENKAKENMDYTLLDFY